MQASTVSSALGTCVAFSFSTSCIRMCMNHFINLYATDPGESKVAIEKCSTFCQIVKCVLGLPQPSFPKSILIKAFSTVAEFPPLIAQGCVLLGTVQR